MTELQIIEQEIAQKGKCYVICTAYDATDFADALCAACEKAQRAGAKTLHFAMRDDVRRWTEDAVTLGGRRFVFDTSFVQMEKPLVNTPLEIAPLHAKPLRAGNAALFCAIYNEAFFLVPNSRTMDDAELRELEQDERREAGFWMNGGEPVGVWILDKRESAPEIAALAIREDFRKEGYGRRALHTLEVRVQQEGYGCVRLLVAKSNLAAVALYEKAGFGNEKEISRWYQTQL